MKRCIAPCFLGILWVGAVAVAAAAAAAAASGKEKVKISAPTQRQQIGSLIAGAMSGSISTTLLNPLEVIKIQQQSSNSLLKNMGPITIAKQILSTEGPRGFFRGLGASLVGIIPARASYFWAYSSTKSILTPYIGDGTLTHMISGIAAGATGNTLTNPIWCVKTRVQLLADTSAGQVAYKGYRQAIRLIYQEEGFRGFYRGLSASLWGTSEGCIQFVIYERIKKRLRSARELAGEENVEKLPFLQYLAAGGLSKFVASCATYPHEVARTRLREQAKQGVFKYSSMWQTLRVIAKEEGRSGLYGGMGTHLARVVPATAIMFLSYETISDWLAVWEEEGAEGFQVPLIEDGIGSIKRLSQRVQSLNEVVPLRFGNGNGNRASS
jgi:solute carrier family 25 protein 33/36